MRRPDLADLERGIRRFRESPAASAEDAASRYEQRVVQNLEDVVRRERESGERLHAASRKRLATLLGRDGSLDELEAELCRRLALGAIDWTCPALMQHLRAEAILRLRIDNPRYWSLVAAATSERET